jgi:hypothetical protein
MARLTIEEKHRNAEMRYEMSLMRLDEARVKQTLKIMEEIPEFAQDPDEKDWVIGSGSGKDTYTPQELDTILSQARKLQYKPAGRNILQTLGDFTIGKSASIEPSDENQATIDYWKLWQERNNFDIRSKEFIRRLFRDGEVFLRWFKKGNDMVFRFLNPLEIKPKAGGKPTYGIETDPDDYERIISYHRAYTDENNTLHEEDIPAEEIDHWKIMVDEDVKRGVSFFIGLAKYITEYEQWLADRIKINKIRHIWNIVGEPVAGGTNISDLKGKLQDVTRDVPSGFDKPKKVTKPGSILFSKGMKWDLKSLNINASDTADDGRAIQLMIAIGTNFPEYIIRADASNANYASSMVSESPFVRAMESWQDYLEKPFKKIYKRVIENAIANGEIKSTYKAKVTTFDKEKQVDIETEEERESSTDCTINFATLIHRDLKQDTDAVQIHTGEKWCSKKTASAKFGYDWEEEQEEISREAADEEAEMKRKADLYGLPNMDTQNQPGAVPGQNDNQQNQE